MRKEMEENEWTREPVEVNRERDGVTWCGMNW
jgi:hypothetical protein